MPGERKEVTMSRLQEVQAEVADRMDEIKSLFKAGAKITVLVRHPGKPEQDFLMTDDHLDEVVAAANRRKVAGSQAA
jgi:hypothetical protein